MRAIGGWTMDGRTDIMMVIVAFRSFANAPKMISKVILQSIEHS